MATYASQPNQKKSGVSRACQERQRTDQQPLSARTMPRKGKGGAKAAPAEAAPIAQEMPMEDDDMYQEPVSPAVLPLAGSFVTP